MAHLNLLGRSGLAVSPFTLGTMTFGNESWGSSDTASGQVLDAYLDAGGTTLDTADVYSGGRSESLIGSMIAERGIRHQVVLATKSGFNDGGGPLSGGSGRKHVSQAIEGSLRRLATDYLDLYWLHVWDGQTTAAELVETFAALIRSGKILYYGLSNVPAWFAVQVATLAAAQGLPGPIALQLEYSLVERGLEGETIRAAHELGLGIVAWSPLGGGLLSGKYRRQAEQSATDAGRLSGENPFGTSKFTDKNWHIADVLRQGAAEAGTSPARLALEWVSRRPGVDSVLVGSRTPEQLSENIAPLPAAVTESVLALLDEASTPTLSPLSQLYTPGMLDAVIRGGQSLRGH